MVKKQALPQQKMTFIINHVHPQAEIMEVKRLIGSTSSILHSVSLASDAGGEEMVIRQIDNQNWLSEEPDLVSHEARSLQVAEQVSVTTPELIAFDATGKMSGMPALLMTQVDGTVILQPRDLNGWLLGLAKCLADIHVTEVKLPDTYDAYTNSETVQPPTWTAVPDMWKKAIDYVCNKEPPHESHAFIHRDFHPANVLWKDGQIAGVVDWVNACLGPKGVDVGHCRWNLAMLHSVAAADCFLENYCRYMMADFTYNPYWDLVSILDVLSDPIEVYSGWAAFGVTDITKEKMAKRMDAYCSSVMNRI